MKVFYVYSHKDEMLRDELEAHLSMLKRQGAIEGWHDRKIAPGANWEYRTLHALDMADIILLLVSADFLASDFCYCRELEHALERHNRGEARVIPIILRDCDWNNAPFAKLQALPKDALPVTSWPNRDSAWTTVAKGIRKVVLPIATTVEPVDIPSSKEPEKLEATAVARGSISGQNLRRRPSVLKNREDRSTSVTKEILIVDDQLGAIGWLEDLLEWRGYSVTLATTEQAARTVIDEFAAGTRPLLMGIFDIMLPSRDLFELDRIDRDSYESWTRSGLRLCQYVRETLLIPASELPIVCLSARQDEELVKALADLGIPFFSRRSEEIRGYLLENLPRLR